MKEIKIKSNGLRNELKEISKSIDKLTNVVEHAIHMWATTQTNQQHEEINYHDSCGCIGECEYSVCKRKKMWNKNNTLH